MKELSIKEKAKAYEETLNRAKKELNACGSQDCDAARQIFGLFPELSESEDERIRKELIEHVRDQQSSFISAPDCRDEEEEKENTKYNSWIAWLEKQGEQRPVIVPKFMVGDFIKLKDSDETYEVSKIEIFDTDEIYYHLTNGGCVGENADNFELVEQKPVDKAEPKFEVGDKIRKKTPSSFDRDMQVARIEKDYYVCNHIGKFSSEVVPFSKEVSYELVEQKPAAWSEEDETKIKSIIALLKSPALCTMDGNKGIIDENIKYLKFLKERYTWKPSDEQMDVLLSEVTAWTKGCPKQTVLESLYNDLKKLK